MAWPLHLVYWLIQATDGWLAAAITGGTARLALIMALTGLLVCGGSQVQLQLLQVKAGPAVDARCASAD
jgi:hypothetical protein